MKKVFYKIFLSVILITLISSCDSYLNPGYDEYLAKDEVFTNYNYSLNYVRTMYSYLPGGFMSVGGAMEAAMTDEVKHSDESSSIQIMNNGTWDSRTYLDAGTWAQNYNGIRRVHVFLANVDNAIFLDPNNYKISPELNDIMRIQLRAEARFLRAFYYFELLKRFGEPSKNLGVPIVPEKVLNITDTIDFPRKTYAECVSYIVNDCDSAAAELPVRQTSVNYGKASKAAALALKSRMLLYAASPLANPTGDVDKWKLAANAAKAVMDLNVYKLLDYKTGLTSDNLLKIFTVPNNDEVIFSSPVTQTNNFEILNLPPSFSGHGQTNPTQDLVDAFETNTGYPITNTSSLYNPTNPFNRRDKRLGYFIVTYPSNIGIVNVDALVGGKDGLNSRVGATKTGYYIRKFMDPAADILSGRTVATHFWVHFRYAEILLNYAEAMTHAYGPNIAPGGYITALAALTQVRERQSASASSHRTPAYMQTLATDDFVELIKNERRVELCFEGHRFWDVRRWNNGVKYFNIPIHGMKITKDASGILTYEIFEVEQRVFDPKMNAMPIPYSEIQKSKLLIQNEGW